jgi:oligopeptidase B
MSRVLCNQDYNYQRIEVPQPRKASEKIRLDHGAYISDDFYYLRDETREEPEVLNYLQQENQYFEEVFRNSCLSRIQDQLFDEMLQREQINSETHCPWKLGEYYYYKKTVDGDDDQPYYFRRKGEDGPEELLLDPNQVGGDVHFFEISPNHRYVAYGYEYCGDERYTLTILDTATNKILEEETVDNLGSVEDPWDILRWSANSDYILYLRLDKTGRAKKLWRHKIGTDPNVYDELMFTEADESFSLALHTTTDERYFILEATSGISNQLLYLPTSNPTGDLKILVPHKKNVMSWVEHHGDYFYIGTSENAPNFAIYQVKVDEVEQRDKWRSVLPHNDEVMLINMDAFENYFVIYEQTHCQKRIRVVPLDKFNSEAEVDFTKNSYYINFPEVVYSLIPGNADDNRGSLISRLKSHLAFESSSLIVTYSSLVTPRQIIEIDLHTRDRTVLWEQTVPNYNPDEYASARLWAPTKDGKRVPISIVYRKDMKLPGKPNPLLLVGYGAYGQIRECKFGIEELSLLDRGFIFAIAHVRGGTEMGTKWYEEGKLLNKPNTINDFIACAEYVINNIKITTPEQLVIYGRSAGGLLVSAATNARPDLFKAVIAEVPFVDVIRSMSDPSIPWITFDFAEWGDANNPRYYNVMKSYCPITNLRHQQYPHMFVTAGLNDPRVSYWEPAKYVAKLRTIKRDLKEDALTSPRGAVPRVESDTCQTETSSADSLLMFKTKMEGGHFSSGGVKGRLEEVSQKWAFLLAAVEDAI